MNRFALALCAGIALAATGARADDESPEWRRLAAKAADYNSRAWVRLEAADGRAAWVDSRDAARLASRRDRPRRVLILWPDSTPFVPHVGEGVRYTITELTYNCGRRTLIEHSFFFHPDGALLAERAPEAGEFQKDDLIYELVCKGAGVTPTRSWNSAAEVIANEPDYGLEEE